MGKKNQACMNNLLLALVLLLVAYNCATAAGGGRRGHLQFEAEAADSEGKDEQQQKKLFMLQEEKEVVRTEAGVIKVVSGGSDRLMKSLQKQPLIDIGFITMEPKSLLLPHYLDSTLVLFVRLGDARIGHIYKDELVERDLKAGDIYTIEAGSAFYLVNTAGGQRLRIICSIVGTSPTIGSNPFQPFFIGGGKHPASVLAGFDFKTLSTAFNVSGRELGELLGANLSGPIVPLSDSNHPANAWTGFLDLKQEERVALLKRAAAFEAPVDREGEGWTWLFRKLMSPLMSNNDDATDPYNLYESKPDFSNDYGWSMAVDENDYSPLKLPDVTVYLVNLTAGSMMAPHINPRATEYGVVLRGTGEVQVVFPNGTLAMKAEVKEGDVFLVPRFFPFCQIASRNGPFEFFGFTTSARDNQPQFLAGEGSVMQLLRGRELAKALGLSEKRLGELLDAQSFSTILPSAKAAPPRMI
ncbi:unnamed protein product [Cuscuta epithymum]|uniref:Cupin type-1 domain-containing protein n=1 Tax=Cuscuta epithymum TaxID=186058 RepID=A0AAV0CCI7_9ASTE|nr:unnamed protein product [Cuscuta epithymum]